MKAHLGREKTVSTIAIQQRVLPTQTQQRIPRDIGENRTSQTGYQQREARQYTQSRPSGQTTIDGNNHQPARQRSLSNNNYGKNYQNDSQQKQQERHNSPRNMETGFQHQTRPAGGDASIRNNYNQRQQQFVQSSTQKQYQNRPASESPPSSYLRDRSHSYRQSHNFQQHSQANLRSPQLDQIDGNKPFTLPPLQRQSDNQDEWQLWDEQEANYPELNQRQRQPVQRERQQQVQGSFYAGNSQPRSSPGFRQSNAEPTRRPPQFQSSLQREFSSDGYQQQTPYSPWKYVQGGRTMSRNSTQLEDEDWAMPPKYQLGFNSKGNTQPFNRHYQATSPNYQQRVEPQFRV